MKTQFLKYLHNIHFVLKRVAVQPVIRAKTKLRKEEIIATNMDDDS